jgi:diaminopropionate ammonia-lyase
MHTFFINNPTNKISESLTTSILKNSNAFCFHKSLSAYKNTPLTQLHSLAKKFGVANIFVKDESFRFGLNAFKALGASYAIHKILKKKPQVKTFCTATDGNHGRAVAWAANRLHKHAVVFVPKNTTDYRIDAIKKEGANVLKVNGSYEETCAHAEEVSIAEGWQLVQDIAWDGYEEIPAEIMAGYLTHFKELEDTIHTETQAKVDIVFLQAGVGSWAASAVWYYLDRYGANRPKLVIVEPSASNGIFTSFKQGSLSQPTGNLDTIMAGLNCGIPSSTAWEIIKNGVDAAITIDDTFAIQAMKALYYPSANDSKIISGESGAGGLAGFMAMVQESKYDVLKTTLGINENTNILFFCTEGATDLDNFNAIIKQV